jgi:peptidyl-prolyl cis-trans isomerase A (cyclophilin A)
MLRALHAPLVLSALAAAGCESGGCPRVDPPRATEEQRVLLDPASPEFDAVPPDTFLVQLETTSGEILIEVIREWAPLGAARFYNLVRHGFYDGSAFFRVLPGFMAQFGVHAVPEVQAKWNDRAISDDPVRQSNRRGTVTFATAGPDTRSTQLFINYGDNSRLDGLGFAPIGRVVRGMAVADRFFSDYGETAPTGQGPEFPCMLTGGRAYLERRFPRLDGIVKATLVAVATQAIVDVSYGPQVLAR